jgi:hypothetical protein
VLIYDPQMTVALASLSALILVLAVWKLDETLNLELPSKARSSLTNVVSDDREALISKMLSGGMDGTSNGMTNGVANGVTKGNVKSSNANEVISGAAAINSPEQDPRSQSLLSNLMFLKSCAIYAFTAFVYIIYETL